MMRFFICSTILLTFTLATQAAPLDALPDAQGVDFFEKKIRPVLAEHCYSCHSAEAQKNNKLKGGLLLDTAAGLLAGGDTGPSLVPRKPEDSLLYKTLTYEHDIQMPPKGRLADSVIKDFKTWIAMGAPDPRQGGVTKKQVGLTIEEGRQFWSFQPIKPPVVPTVSSVEWSHTAVDRFIKSRLDRDGLTPAPRAPQAILARRLYFDLTGLPPTPEQVAEFVADTSPKATEKLVDQLLASRAFGERWGRHWLDVARYAESLTLRGFIFKEAWRYRDYVIRSFNQDLPFSQFIREQIAGDLLPANTPQERERLLTATTFLMLGNTNLEEQDKKLLRMDVVDEQLDVISKGFLAQTVTCARCHDHKFDPIPTKDYYALAGILRNAKSLEHANVSKWIEVPLPVDAATEAALQASQQEIAKLEAELKSLKGKSSAGLAKGVLAIQDVPGIVVDDTLAKKVGTWQDSTHSGSYIGKGYTHDQNDRKGEKTITFQPELPHSGKYEVLLAYSPGGNRAKRVPVTVFSAEGETTVHIDMSKNPTIDQRFVSLGTFRFEKTGQSFVLIDNEGTVGHVTADAVTFIPENVEKVQKQPAASHQDRVKELEAKIKQLQASAPQRPRVMSVVEEKTIEDARIHVRGSVQTLGAIVPRGVLQVATYGNAPTMPKNQSGRKELADWIASDQNPLTARVIVNRVWHWIFGSGLVRTVDNFGVTGEKPSHPELLDHLASEFIRDRWSIKKLVRAIVLSRTYQSSSDPATCQELTRKDPENRLFGRANRKRLEAEAIRDAMLVIARQLEPHDHGPTYPANLTSDYGHKSQHHCRSVYLPMFRNSPPELLELFDMADPSLVTGKRNTSTVAPQALYLLNSAFVQEQASAAGRQLQALQQDHIAAIQRLYQECLGRDPTNDEVQVALKFLARDPKTGWAGLYHVLFASAAFRFLD